MVSSSDAEAGGPAAVRFSKRVGRDALNPIAKAERQARLGGVALRKLNDSNPTVHGLAPGRVPGAYDAQPRGPLASRRLLADFLTERNRAEAQAEGRDGGTAHVVDPERLYLLSSTSEAYSWIFKLMCDAGDVVLGPKPGYPLIESIGRLENVETMEYQLGYDGSWTLSVSDIAALLETPKGARVKALVAINPNNPTGSYVKPDEREALVRLCASHGIAIIADEVFFDYSLEPFKGNRRFAGESGALVFALDGFSKLLAAPHAKVGWIEVSGPDELVRGAQQRLDVIADDYLPMSNIILDELPDLLACASEQLNGVQRRTRANLHTLHAMLAGDPMGLVTLLRAEGGWNVLLRFPEVIDENELVLRLIDHYGVTGQPGYFFDMTSNGYMAVSLLPQPDVFEANIEALLAAVNDMLS